MSSFFSRTLWILACMAISVGAFGAESASDKILRLKGYRAKISSIKPSGNNAGMLNGMGDKNFQKEGKALAIRHIDSLLVKLKDANTIAKSQSRLPWKKVDATPLNSSEKETMATYLVFSTPDPNSVTGLLSESEGIN